jgi:hypothetical protein
MNFLNVENAVLLIGLTYQSNAVGHADNSELLSAELLENEYLKMFNAQTGTFENLNIGLGNNNSTAGHHGIELGLAQEAQARYGVPIYMAKYAVGGTPLNQQVVGGAVREVYYHQHLAPAIQLLRNQGKRVFFVQCIWGGESNSSSASTISAFTTAFPELYNDYKAIFGNKVSFIAFEVNETYYTGRILINDVFRNIAKDSETFSVIETATLPAPSDNVHFNASSFKIASKLLLDELESNEPMEVKFVPDFVPVVIENEETNNYEPELQALLNRATSENVTLPSLEFRTKLNDFYLAMKSNNLLSKLDFFYLFKNDSGLAFSNYNLIAPNSFKGTWVNSPIFNMNNSVSTNGTNQYFKTAFIPSVNSKYQKDNASFGFVDLTNLQQTKYDCSVYDGVNFTGVCKNLVGNSMVFINCNNATGHSVKNIGNFGVIGLNHFQRETSTEIKIMNDNGTFTHNSLSDGVPTKEFYFAGRNNNGPLGFPSANSYQLHYAGESFSESEFLTFKGIINTLLQ